MRPERIRCIDIRADSLGDQAPSSDFDALVDSIRLHSVLRPVLLRTTPDGYIIVHGERRWRAAQAAGLETIPALIVQDISFGESTSAERATLDSAFLD
jgi:ParB family transcriptional regulator, chromosome partitioning protein